LNFITVAIFYLLLGAPFIAMSQVTVYAGAIMVLFLFVIMLLGAETLLKEFNWRRVLFPGFLAIVLIVEASYLLVAKARPAGDIVSPDDSINAMQNIRDLGMVLFSKYLLPFEVTSILLLVAMVGSIILTKKQKGEQK